MANGIDLATATNLMIRRHAYSVACTNDFAEQSDSGSLLEVDIDDSTNLIVFDEMTRADSIQFHCALTSLANFLDDSTFVAFYGDPMCIYWCDVPMANGIDLATAPNLMIRRHAYSVACSNEFAEQSDSRNLLEVDTDDSTNDGSIPEMD